MTTCITLDHIDDDGRTDVTRQHVYAVTYGGENVFVVSNVTPAGAQWYCDEMALVDDHDAQQIAAYAKDLRKRAPAKFSWVNQQREQERLAATPLRGYGGRFHTQGAR